MMMMMMISICGFFLWLIVTSQIHHDAIRAWTLEYYHDSEGGI
jgi:hypothetical protein